MNGRPPRVGVNLFVHESFRTAAGPLFERELVDALEWDVDEAWGFGGGVERLQIPHWVNQILDAFSEGDSLYAHGVWFSILSARWEERQEKWLSELRRECRKRQFRHLSEHFGFMTAGGFTRGTMFPAPFTPEAVRVGRDRLARLADASGLPVGLENSAVALCVADAEEQGDFMDEVLAPSDGFLVFDVHNLWAQARNLGLSAKDLLSRYPLERAREMHVSGGRWRETTTDPHKGPFRLDSHDGPTPDEVFELVPLALSRCPNLEVVFFEHRGAHLESEEEITRYQDEFYKVRALVESVHGKA
jgi:uncharacterized protein (UPF0276 family)